jgi:hypothetical protein
MNKPGERLAGLVEFVSHGRSFTEITLEGFPNRFFTVKNGIEAIVGELVVLECIQPTCMCGDPECVNGSTWKIVTSD